MTPSLRLLFVLGFIFAHGRLYALGQYLSIPNGPSFYCSYSAVIGTFNATGATYSFIGVCTDESAKIVVPWNAVGAFEPATGNTKENISLNGPSPYRGTISVVLRCLGLRGNLDPWLSDVKCSGIPGMGPLSAQGEFASDSSRVDYFFQQILRSARPMTSSFAYDRNALLAKRDNDLKAEARAEAQAKAQAEAQRRVIISKPAGTFGALVAPPTILSPTPGQSFIAGELLPIKLAPKGGSVTHYAVNIQRRSFNGTWDKYLTDSTVPAAYVEAAGGYTGLFGNPGPGRSNVYYSTPGAWRVNAQTLSPTASDWSNWVEFSVVPVPPPALKKPPKSLIR